MRHLKALVVALSIFIAALAYYKCLLQHLESVQVACAGIFALLGYRWGMRAGLPAIVFFPLFYIGGFYGQTWYSVIGTNVEGRTHLFFAGLALVYLHHPVLLILRKLTGRQPAWRHHAWSSLFAVLLLTFWPWVAFNYCPAPRQYQLVLFAFTLLNLPMALIGFLARHESHRAATTSNAQNAAFRSWVCRFRALWSRRGRPLFVRMLQGWLVAVTGIGIATMITLFVIRQFDSLSFVAISSVLCPLCARLGRKMRLGTLCILLLLSGLFQHAGYVLGFGRISELMTPEYVQAVGWPMAAWNILNLICGLLAELALLGSLLAVLAYGVRVRLLPWRVLKWSFTLAAACLAVIVVTQSILFMLADFSLSFWLHGSWTMTVVQGLIVLPPALMALALWLHDGRPARKWKADA